MEAFLKFGREGFDILQPYPLLQALIVIVIFLVLAKLVDAVFTSILRRLVSRTTTNFDDQLIAIMHRPIFMSVAAIGLVFATWRLKLTRTRSPNRRRTKARLICWLLC